VNHVPSTILALLALCAAAPVVRTQDPAEIKRIVEKVDAELTEIEKLLQQSARAAKGEPSRMLKESAERSTKVVEGIDELIRKLEEMRQQNQQQQRQQGQQQRRENESPEFQQQRQQGEQQGQEQQQQPQPGQEQPQPQPQPGQPQPGGERDQPMPGENQQGNQAPQDPTAPGQPGTGDGSWGELQPYVNFLKNRGSPPKVPEKFRKYWQEYLRQKK
jgi:TolA-binding protein